MPVPETYRRSDTQPESKHLRAEDYELDQKWRLTVEDVELVTLEGRDGKPPRKRLVLHFDGKAKGLVLNATNQSFLEARFGLNPNDWIGSTVVLHRTTTVFGDKTVPAFRLIEAKKVASAPKAKPTPRPVAEDDYADNEGPDTPDDSVPF